MLIKHANRFARMPYYSPSRKSCAANPSTRNLSLPNRVVKNNSLSRRMSSSQASPANSKLRMILLGAPGSGKGTLSSKLIERFRLDIIGIGDLLRRNVEKQTKIGRLAESYISKGDLLPDPIILEIVQPELKKLKNKDWILDGLPRTRQQAIQLDKFMKSELNDQLNLVVSLEVPTEVILKRITERWIHAPSGRVYNTTYTPPKVMGKDDITGEPLIKRKDDTVEVFSNRLRLFHNENKPLLEYYDNQFVMTGPEAHKRKKLAHLFGTSSDEIWPQIDKVVKEHFPHLTSQ
ncbi:hypothetical protein O181_024582 [Austropuccinia psidii MF-1]|uniref:GTP:AMP phosphotransferase, mitochondrial n=1 Tax=Austropuccinia psidii MF-1 TaxID=1389203 RepID=A0A9Q3CJK5_9BASI|nr:hypothetical protein [Austropuccinia psidii MF-1]